MSRGFATAMAMPRHSSTAMLCHHVWTAFLVYQREVGAPRMSKKTKEVIQRFVWLAVQESKEQLIAVFSHMSPQILQSWLVKL